ncbi:MAG: hypothetical protein NC117_07340 [Pseudoflavonifractor sp.]|nr:hypothetical protein [Pseudoflavonifractor sp.]
MNRLIFLTSLIIAALAASAQRISDNILLPDGRVVGKDHIFLAGENGKFHVETARYPEAVWKFYLIMRWSLPSEVELVSTSQSPTESFIIDIDSINWWYARSYTTHQPGTPVYCKGILTTSYNGFVTDMVELTFNLFPAKPIVKDITLDYTFYWDYHDLGESGILSASVASERATGYSYGATGIPFQYEWPENGGFHWSFDWEDADTTNDYTRISNEYAEWGTHYVIYAKNKYGAVSSDTIFTTDYIHDPDVLAAIGYPRVTESEDITKENDIISVKYENGKLLIAGDVDSVTEVRIYNVSGVNVNQSNKPSDIDLSSLIRGCYVAVLRLENGRNVIYKFHKL